MEEHRRREAHGVRQIKHAAMLIYHEAPVLKGTSETPIDVGLSDVELDGCPDLLYRAECFHLDRGDVCWLKKESLLGFMPSRWESAFLEFVVTSGLEIANQSRLGEVEEIQRIDPDRANHPAKELLPIAIAAFLAWYRHIQVLRSGLRKQEYPYLAMRIPVGDGAIESLPFLIEALGHPSNPRATA